MRAPDAPQCGVWGIFFATCKQHDPRAVQRNFAGAALSTAFAQDPAHSLAATSAGESVQIRRILFGALRALCADLGVREGDIVLCRAGTSSHLLLDTPEGRTVTLERDWARFIQVASCNAGLT